MNLSNQLRSLLSDAAETTYIFCNRARPYTVAQHSLVVASMVTDPNQKLWALVHDLPSLLPDDHDPPMPLEVIASMLGAELIPATDEHLLVCDVESYVLLGHSPSSLLCEPDSTLNVLEAAIRNLYSPSAIRYEYMSTIKKVLQKCRKEEHGVSIGH